MTARHAMDPRPSVSPESFDMQWEHSKRMAEASRARPLQERVDEYVAAHRANYRYWQEQRERREKYSDASLERYRRM